jgi:hypothetical protein
LAPSTIFFYLLSPHFWNNFNMSHFSIFIHEYIIFPLYWASHTPSLYPFPCHWYPSPRQNVFYFTVFCFWKKKKKAFLFVKDSSTGMPQLDDTKMGKLFLFTKSFNSRKGEFLPVTYTLM